MRTLFRLSFRIVRGADARAGNPFAGPDSDRLIVSMDTLAGERMFARMRDAVASGAARPYDLVVFDEAHKLAADEDADGGRERHEAFEERALGGLTAVTLAELREERAEVETLLRQARRLAETGEDSKFEKLRAIMSDPALAPEKLIVFTEHRDTAEFLVRRLEELGFTGRVALIHGGLDYREREARVELFRRAADRGGASHLIATDAAGEGINLQFCWLRVNYDVPWNPARLEQRMGRIHRYGQTRDPVVIVNLVAGETREGRVLKVLLDKLEAIRRQLSSDKVFDVVGRLFENVPLKEYLERAATEEGARRAIEELDRRLTPERVADVGRQERDRYGRDDVRSHLPEINAAIERERYRRLIPGYVRRFVETAAPLIDLRLEGDAGGVFDLAPDRPRAADAVRGAMDAYPETMRGRMTVHRPGSGDRAIWMHPGEPVFDAFHAALLARRGSEALRGAVFVDPCAEAPYLFHLAQVSVVRRGGERPGTVETRPIGLRQESDGAIAPCPLEHLLLLRGDRGVAPGGVPIARSARRLTEEAGAWVKQAALRLAEEHRARIREGLPERRRWTAHGYARKEAVLMERRQRVSGAARRGDADAQAALAEVKEQQKRLAAERQRRLALLDAESSRIGPGETTMIAYALVVPADDPEERQRHDAEVEAVAMDLARAHEEAAGAAVRDVSRPVLARREGLGDWPGFDLRSRYPADARGPAEDRAIEVKGRAGSGAVEVSDNEWAAACNLRDRYWLYVVFDCATPHPRLVRVRDPFGRLLTGAKGGVVIAASEILSAADDGAAAVSASSE